MMEDTSKLPVNCNEDFCNISTDNLFSPEESSDIENTLDKHSLSKTDLVSPNESQYNWLTQLLSQKVVINHGEFIFTIGESEDDVESGISNEELASSKCTLERILHDIKCDCTFLRMRSSKMGCVEEYLIRQKFDDNDFLEVRVAVVGNVDAGKSTILGVLTHGELDNGRGYSRQKLFRHKHEIESGRTSSVGNEILGFGCDGSVVNSIASHLSHKDCELICSQSSKVVTFFDLAGHEKYLKTTVFGMTSHIPDFCMLMVGGNAGIVGTTKEHLGLALALNVPVFVVVSKIDMCPSNVLQETIKLLLKILKSPGCRKIPVLVSSKDDVVVTATNFTSERICPIFQVSNVTGQNMDLLKLFLNLLKCRTNFHVDGLPEFLIHETFSVPGVGTVVSGTVTKGAIHAGETLLLGPDFLGKFNLVQIKSIHRNRLPVQIVNAGQSAAIALKKVKRVDIRRGMVLVHVHCNPKAVWEYKGEVRILHHPSTITCKYQAVVHCGNIRQTASILSMSKEYLRSGDKAIIKLRFTKNPEYLKRGTKFIFREGRTKAVGTVIELIEDAPDHQTHLRKTKFCKNKVRNSIPK